MVESGEDPRLPPDRDPEYGEALARRRPAWLRLHVRHLGSRHLPSVVAHTDLRPSGYSTPPTPYQRDRPRPIDRRLARMTRALLARRERVALCDLALVLGEDAPTLCGDWTAKDLVAHLLVRERSPLAVVGTGAAAVRPDRARDGPAGAAGLRGAGRAAARPRPDTAGRCRRVDKLFNTVEYFVHHEDLRRAQPDWEPRELRRGRPGRRSGRWSRATAAGWCKDAGRAGGRRGVPTPATTADPAQGRRTRPWSPGRRRRWCSSCSVGSRTAVSSSTGPVTSMSRALRSADARPAAVWPVSGWGGRRRRAPP